MARNRSKDSDYFNCSQKHEVDYVVGLYTTEQQPRVRIFITNACNNGIIKYTKHSELYELIKLHLGFDIPA